MLTVISKGTVLYAKARQGQVGTVQQGHTVGPLLRDGFGQALIFTVILGGFVLGAGFFQIGADFAVGLLDIPDGCFQFGSGFVLQLFRRFTGIHGLREQQRVLLAYFFPLCSQFGDALIQTVHFFQCFIPLAGQLMELLALALILAVAGKDFLLLADEVGRADRLFRCIRVGDQLLGKVLFLCGQLAGEGALVVQGLDLHVTGVQLSADADDPQQDIGLFLVGGFHEAGQVQRQRLHKGVEQLLPATPPGGVSDGQTGIFALAFHHHTVGKLDLQMRRSHCAVPLGSVRAETVAAEGPCQSVQHAGLALIVVAAHDGEASGRRRECNGLDAFDVFGFQSRDLYRHADTSP